MIHIPKGSSAEDVKARKKLIGDFYSKWCAEYHSINETKGQASITYESTRAVFLLTRIMSSAVVKKVDHRKANDRNQRPYDKMILLRFREINLIVGHQKKTDEYVQYCITAKK